jgi:hypothetical protein
MTDIKWENFWDYDYPEEINGAKLVRTCMACPEQYEVFYDNQQIGYLRLRHGHFRADYPDCGGETVYRSEPKGDGVFADDERFTELANAVFALMTRHLRAIA